MTIKTPWRARTAAPLLCAVLLASPAAAQQKLQVGAVAVTIQADSVTGQDRSYAMLKPDGAGEGEEGALLWACGGDANGFTTGVRLEMYANAGETRRVAWTFDQETADTLVVEGEDDRVVWFLSDRDQAAVTARARGASRLTVHMPGTPTRGPYHYALAGLDSALHRLGCAAASAPAGTSAGRETLHAAPALAAVTPPRVANGPEFLRILDRNYPRLFRNAGVPGEVVVRFRVLEDGSVDPDGISVLSATDDEFREPAIRSVLRLRFHPALVYERPVKIWIEQRVRFQLP